MSPTRAALARWYAEQDAEKARVRAEWDAWLARGPHLCPGPGCGRDVLATAAGGIYVRRGEHAWHVECVGDIRRIARGEEALF